MHTVHSARTVLVGVVFNGLSVCEIVSLTNRFTNGFTKTVLVQLSARRI